MQTCYADRAARDYAAEEDEPDWMDAAIDEITDELSMMPITDLIAEDERLIEIVNDIAKARAIARHDQAMKSAAEDKAERLADMRG